MDWSGVDWRWVGIWAGKVFLAFVPLGVFLYLVASPVVRPGGVISALPTGLAYAVAGSAALAAVTAAVLAVRAALHPPAPPRGLDDGWDDGDGDEDVDDDDDLPPPPVRARQRRRR
ncbi:MAG: hypothetical protein H6843_14985 [Rhodospirillaceae bacterium]|nr:hypothetical protein [Rhodospirillaceae bacterium]